LLLVGRHLQLYQRCTDTRTSCFVYTVKTSRFHKGRHLLSNFGITNIQQFGANQPTSQPVLTLWQGKSFEFIFRDGSG